MKQFPQRNIAEEFLDRVKSHPDKTALTYVGTSFSYQRLASLAMGFASGLSELDVMPGDKVMLYLQNCPQWIVAWLGILIRGAVAVPIAPIYTVRDLNYIANDSGATSIVCSDTNFGYVAQAAQQSGIKSMIHTNVADLLPWHKRSLGWLMDLVPTGRLAKNSQSRSFVDLIKGRQHATGDPEKRGDDLAEILYTGGTTKYPKAVPITHRLFLESTDVALHVAEEVIPWGSNVLYQGAPFFHILGQNLGLGALCLGGDQVVVLPKVNIDGIMAEIQRRKARSMVGVPTLYRMILEHDRIDQYDLGSLRYCFCGGDVLPNDLARNWLSKFGIPLSQGYGSTEAVGGISLSPAKVENPPGSMGKVLPHKKIRIVDVTLKEVETGKPGELMISSDPMVSAYLNKPEETQASFIELDGRLWYRSGDIVRQDKQGYLYFVDRTVDTIKHKGYRVSASEVEAVLQEHEAVIAACVVGVPDEKVGERIKAFVVLKEDIKGMSGSELIRWCRKSLASYKIPQYIEFRDMLPKSKVGKMLRREVRDEERKLTEEGKWSKARTE